MTHFALPSRWIAGVAGAAVLAASVLCMGADAYAQDAAAIAKDAIYARKTMMSSLSDGMDVIEAMIQGGKIDLNSAHEHADQISVLLMAFPHMFPASTNQWKAGAERDPTSDTFASPDLWTKYADFYKKTADASKAAYNASRADDDAELKKYIGELRTGCNACHAAYLKPE